MSFPSSFDGRFFFSFQRQFTCLESDIFTMSEGLPQGSTLSPTLFNVMMADIPHPMGIMVYEYADDIAIAVTADDIQAAEELIKKGIGKLEEWEGGG